MYKDAGDITVSDQTWRNLIYLLNYRFECGVGFLLIDIYELIAVLPQCTQHNRNEPLLENTQFTHFTKSTLNGSVFEHNTDSQITNSKQTTTAPMHQ